MKRKACIALDSFGVTVEGALFILATSLLNQL
jgi:hypothetical protein